MRFTANTNRVIFFVPYTNKGEEITIEIIAFTATAGRRDNKKDCAGKYLLIFSVIAEGEMLNLRIFYYTKILSINT